MDRTPSFLVTAGGTRERVDRVRYWGNVFTGKTGLDLARALVAVGNVTLVTSNVDHAAEFGNLHGPTVALDVKTFGSHAELRAILEAPGFVKGFDGVFMTAAVSDYLPAGAVRVVEKEEIPGSTPRRYRLVVEDVQADKISSAYGEVAFLGTPTAKLVDLFRGVLGFTGLLVKFKLEVGLTDVQLIDVAGRSRLTSGADFIVANTLEMVDGPDAGAFIIGSGGEGGEGETVTRVPRRELSGALAELAARYVKTRKQESSS